jgi:hypothetical protein
VPDYLGLFNFFDKTFRPSQFATFDEALATALAIRSIAWTVAARLTT